MKRVMIGFVLLAAGLLLTACQSQVSQADTIQTYLQARVQSDVNQMVSLSCPEWEGQARIEASTFQALKAQLQDVSCAEASASGGVALVACKGKIVTTYNGESREWNLADHQFKLVQQDGEWRMCGYQ